MKKIFFVMSFLLMSSLALAATIPKYVTVQGRLTDVNDVPVPSGSYLFNFTIWNDPTAGTLIWTDQFNAPVSNGVFNIELGRNAQLNIPFDQPYFLEVRVGGNLLTPRVNFTSAAYAFTSASGGGGGNGWTVGTNTIYNSTTSGVGIGTASPGAILDVYGSSAPAIRISYNSTVYSVISTDQLGRMALGPGNSNPATIIIGSPSPWTIPARIAFTRYDGSNWHESYIGYQDTSNQLQLFSNGNQVQIPSNGLYVNGNVGIGTASPQAKLDVAGPINVSGDVKPSTWGGGNLGSNPLPWNYLYIERTEIESLDGSTWPELTGNQSQLRVGALGSSASNPVFVVNVNNGYVGIGTTTPSAKLDTVGVGSFRGASNGGGNLGIALSGTSGLGMHVGYDSANNKAFIRAENPGNTYNDLVIGMSTLNIGNNIGSRLYIDSSGNVGIGTTTPQQKLDVAGNMQVLYSGTIESPGTMDTNNGMIETSYGAGDRYGLGQLSNGITALYTSTHYSPSSIQFGLMNSTPSFNSLMTISHGGNVGIGTTSPAYQLSLGNNLVNTKLAIWDGGAGASLGLGVQANQFRFNINNANDRFSFLNGEAGTEIFTILGSGKIGIGTTSPTYQLQLSTDSAAKPSTNTWTISSDSRIKTNVSNFTDGLNIIMKMRPITYNYNGLGGFVEDGTKKVGIIAQELQSIAPYMITSHKAKLSPNDTNETDILDYQGHALAFVTVNAIKEQQQQIEQLKAENLQLKQRLERIENKLNLE